MEQITTLCNGSVSTANRKARPMSFQGNSITKYASSKEPLADLQSITSSNLLIHKQLASTREELVRARRRCAELSEVEARKKGLELRCLGLERVVEELMSAVELLKVTPHQAAKIKLTSLDPQSSKTTELNGLAIRFETCTPYVEDSPQEVTIFGKVNPREVLAEFVVSSRRRFIPYRLRAVVVYIVGCIRNNDLIDHAFAMGIVIVGTILWASLLLVQRGRHTVEQKSRKIGNVRNY
jgi:hypothetical protein